MAVTNFIPQVWSAKLLMALKNAHIYADVVNTDYQGEIQKYGDTVHINSIGPITITDYVPNSTTVTRQKLDQAQTVLTVDQRKYFAFDVDDVDAAQTNVQLMSAAMQEAAYGMRDVIDKYIAALGVAGAGLKSGTVDVPIDVTSANLVATIAGIGQTLDEKNIPQEGRFLIIPPWLHTKFVLAKLVKDSDNSETLTNGRVGRFLGFDIRLSNNVPVTATTKYRVLAGTKMAISFAEGLSKVEAFRPESSFADAVKGLHLYGGKVIYPEALLVLTCTNGTES